MRMMFFPICSSYLIFSLSTAVSAFQPQSSSGSTRRLSLSSSSRVFPAHPCRHGTQMKMSFKSSTSSSKNDFYESLSNFFSKKTKLVPEKPKLPTVVVDSDFTLSYVFGAIGLVIALTNPGKTCTVDTTTSLSLCLPSLFGIVAGGIHIALGLLFYIQANRVRFVFDDSAFELRIASTTSSSSSSMEENLKTSGENIVVGGANRWAYDTFVNWDFFPSVDYPILVYFKETQTPQELWSTAAGQYDTRNNGQVHFFPAIANVKQLQEQFQIRGCKKVPRK